MRQGIIIYQGPSVIDGDPIVVIATGLVRPSPNRKTGALVQVYVIRSDMSPIQAVHSGKDFSVCGYCVHRGSIEMSEDGKRRNVDRSCYVTLIHGPHIVYRSFLDGFYESVPLSVARKELTGRMLRIGAYGDPAAVPMEVWDTVLSRVRDLTAYTHLWREFPALSSFCMASVDTPEEREEAKALGFRTYRVRGPDDPVLKDEGQCPASHELGNAVQCVQCMLCGGLRTNAKADITIKVHGTGAPNFATETAHG